MGSECGDTAVGRFGPGIGGECGGTAVGSDGRAFLWWGYGRRPVSAWRKE
ncbi:MAG: hypothetical protein HS099_05150 [Ardenticatenaceae bacterium]|nr:hypothetical protein [Ardenticatenaceae bacterium]